MNTMNSTTRKVKNPLLTAAGPGFSLDSYTENALLMPVTPATPAVLRDDAELDNFVGQDPTNIQSQVPSRTIENFSVNTSYQPKENKDTTNLPAKPGYLTSILSSLPNLSNLSSTKSDTLGSQISQAPENISGVVHESNPYISSQGCYGSQLETPGFLAINPQDSRGTNSSGFVPYVPTGTVPNPPQPAAPPSLPQSSSAPVSYRLGNQRRLKYAPPPDLTSNNAKPYPNPAIQTFFPNQNVSVPPTILNPCESEGSVQNINSGVQPNISLPEVIPTSEQLSRNSSLHSSFRSSPVAIGAAYNFPVTSVNQNPFSESSSVSTSSQFVSSSRPIPAQVLEPVTPQNTPANVSFPGFTLNRDSLSASNLEEEISVFQSPNQLNSPPEFSKHNTPKTTTESLNKSTLISEKTETFTSISAAKVTEKLEHLLLEQKKDPVCVTNPIATSEVDNITPTSNVATKLTKSFEPQSETQQVTKESIDKPEERKSNDVQGKVYQPISDTWSDVFLGQEPAQSVIGPEIHTANNNLVVSDIQAIKPNVHPPEQHYQDLELTPMPSSTFYLNKPADQKSSLNYIPPVQPLVQPLLQSSVYNPPPKSSNQSASVFFESAKQNRFPTFPPQENNTNISLGKPVVDVTNNLQRVSENSAFNPAAINSTPQVPFWNTDQSSSHSQVLNTVSNQPAHITPNQPVFTAPTRPVPIFYNPVEFVNELPKQPTLSHTYDQYSQQQQSYQNPPFYGSTSGTVLQQPYTAHSEINSTYPLCVAMATDAPEPTGSATLSPVQMSINSVTNRTTTNTVPPSFQNWASGSSDKSLYRPVYHHWFYRKEVENKVLWRPFSMRDSIKLEKVHNSSDITPETTVATDGGRYDVDILRRQRAPVYWTGTSTEVRRCSWFYKGANESRYTPYNESTSAKLEEEYMQACRSNIWNQRIELGNGEYIIFHSAQVQHHYLQATSPELTGSWVNSAGSEDSAYLQGVSSRPRDVKRGVEFNIDEGEPEKVDHLLFLVHGIGSVCDLKFRTVEEVVDEFRRISFQLVQSHFCTAREQGIVNRIEVLPISWHTTLHSEDTGIDKKLQAITLESIPKLRHFTNDTLLDILFYTSPTYCQTIIQAVGSEMNRLHALFKDRNPNFNGDIYLGGHSLGSLIMFDLLCHQNPTIEEDENEENSDDIVSDKGGENDSAGPIKPMRAAILKRRMSKRICYVMGTAGTGQPYINYPQLNFHPRAFFALGSPIGMFVTIRGIDTLGEDFILPTCPAFFNIFHPFDPVAYRVESLINPEAHKFQPMLIPHHKGRKRIHLELKEIMARVGTDFKQKLIDSVRHTWNSFYQLALFHKPDNQILDREIDRVVEEQLQNTPIVSEQQNNDDVGADLKIGKLNGGRRIDYVLQEAPFEYINEYIFALTSHICYWESEDTMLLILKEIYGSRGIQIDAQLPQNTLTIERLTPSPSINLLSALSTSGSSVGTPVVDPTVPVSSKPIGPPPKAGFVPKS